MNLNQNKLTKNEWDNIEIPISLKEKTINNLIINSYDNVNIVFNNSLSIMAYLKVRFSEEMDIYIYDKYLKPHIEKINNKYNSSISPNDKYNLKKITINKPDLIRFKNTDKNLEKDKTNIFEFILLDLMEKMYKNKNKNEKKWLFYIYTLNSLVYYNVNLINKTLQSIIINIIKESNKVIDIKQLITISEDVIEKNNYLLDYADIKLYEHQKQLFTYCKNKHSKLILYIAPTGTGKTISPLGLSSKNKIIFVCAARHVGLALAKSAISMKKKIAFAFGCNDAEDVRLHYYAAKDYTVNTRTGGIWKVDNAIGDKVEIMICDIKSYIPAMYYMLAFNDAENIILYWDEPTITLDYDEHEFHSIIKNNWKNNLIPNVVLSSATLPREDEMHDTIMDFKCKFENSEIYTIESHECKKTIPIINNENYISMPHYLSGDYKEITEIITHCKKYKTLLRYIDLGELIKFILYINENYLLKNKRYLLDNYFINMNSITMVNLKNYYLKVLDNIKEESWEDIHLYFINNREKKYDSTIHFVTNDAHTLTDGPCIFLTDNVTKIAKFCLQEAKIPENLLTNILNTIKYNNKITDKIGDLQKTYEDGTSNEKDKKMTDGRVDPEMKRIMSEIDKLSLKIRSVVLEPSYVPNTKQHLDKYASDKTINGLPFTPEITESIVEEIMLIDDIDNMWKVLLLMGIGVFTNHESISYIEIMKKLAQEQKLYLIIASADYIYGTNYQFCHSYISKDLGYISQEKCIQAMGRVGRNNVQKSYSIRIRNNELINKLFKEDNNKPEVINMSRLFNSE